MAPESPPTQDSVNLEVVLPPSLPSKKKPVADGKSMTREQFDNDLTAILKTCYGKIEKFLRDNPNRSDAARVEFARNTKKALHTLMNKYFSKRSSSAKFIQIQFPLLQQFYSRVSSFFSEEGHSMKLDATTEFSFYSLFLQSPGY